MFNIHLYYTVHKSQIPCVLINSQETNVRHLVRFMHKLIWKKYLFLSIAIIAQSPKKVENNNKWIDVVYSVQWRNERTREYLLKFHYQHHRSWIHHESQLNCPFEHLSWPRWHCPRTFLMNIISDRCRQQKLCDQDKLNWYRGRFV